MRKSILILLVLFTLSVKSQVYVEDSTKPASNTILGETRDGYAYDITFRKVGALIMYNGRIFNHTGVRAGTSLAKIKNPMFNPNYNYPNPVTSATLYTMKSLTTNKAVHLQISHYDGFYLVNDTMPAGSYLVFSGHYSIQEN